MPILDIQAIEKILPHRYPFLLVDRIVELEDMRIVGMKNVTINEPHFTGHFPNFPVMPGVLIVEAMAQTAGVLVLNRMEDRDNKARVSRHHRTGEVPPPVVPGDQLRIEVKFLKLKPSVAKMQARRPSTACVVAEAEIVCTLADKPKAPYMPIHPTAIVDPAASIAETAEIGPYCVIGADVRDR